MGHVVRFDIGSLRPAKRMDDGRVRADAHLTKAGVFRYYNADGTERLELREPREVFAPDSMESFAQVPVTNEHPPELLHARNAKTYMIGSTGEKVLRDDDHVRGSIMVADADTIREMEAGKLAVSCGYTCDVDPTPGVHPVYGKYDARQTNIRGNHVAIVSKARAGDSARVRMDAYGKDAYARKLDMKSYLKDIGDDEDEDDDDREDDELDAKERDKIPSSKFAAGDKLPIHDEEHTRNAMSRFSQTDFEDAAQEKSAYGKIKAAAKKFGIDSSGFEKKHGGRFDHQRSRPVPKPTAEDKKNEQNLLEAAAVQLASATARADEAEAQLADATKRADEAEGKVDTLTTRVKQLEESRTDSNEISKLQKEIEVLRAKVIKAERMRMDAEDPARLSKAVKARVKIESAACLTLGVDRNTFDGLDDRDLMVTVVKKLHGVTIPSDRSDDYVRARFDAAMEGFAQGADALAAMREVAVPREPERRADAKSAREKMIETQRNAWKTPANTQQESK